MDTDTKMDTDTNIDTATAAFKCTGCHFTYKGHLDMEVLIERLSPVKYWSVVWENGDEDHPYEHTHCAVWFGKQTTVTPGGKKSKYDFYDVKTGVFTHPNMKAVGSDHFEYLFHTYHAHPELVTTHKKGPYVKLAQSEPPCLGVKAKVKVIEGCKNMGEVIRLPDMDIERTNKWALMVYSTRSIDVSQEITKNKQLIPYWPLVEEYITKEVDRHRMLWIWSKSSKRWKSTLGVLLGDLGYLPGSPLIKHTLVNYDCHRVIYFDYSRDDEIDYKMIEKLCSGGSIPVSMGWERARRVTAHIIVISNDPPPYSKLCDRLDVLDVEGSTFHIEYFDELKHNPPKIERKLYKVMTDPEELKEYFGVGLLVGPAH